MNTQNQLPLSVLAETPSNTTSDRYSFIPTTRVIKIFENEGWNITKTAAVKPITRDPRFVKHTVQFEHSDFYFNNEEHFRIILRSSHDGSSSFQLFSGLMRLVCSNGLVVGHSVNTARVLHRGFTEQKVQKAISETLSNASKIFNCVDAMKRLELNTDQKVKLYLSALRLIDKAPEPFVMAQLEHARRQADRDSSLWVVFNRVQEKIINGQLVVSATRKDGSKYTRKLKAVRSIDRRIKLNRDLWDLAESFVKVG